MTISSVPTMPGSSLLTGLPEVKREGKNLKFNKPALLATITEALREHIHSLSLQHGSILESHLLEQDGVREDSNYLTRVGSKGGFREAVDMAWTVWVEAKMGAGLLTSLSVRQSTASASRAEC